MIRISSDLSLPDDAVSYTFSRSGGPGGQNVNKVSTRVTLWFDVAGSNVLSERQREKIMRRLAARINNKGVLQVVSMQFRTQKANREETLRRFVSLMAAALVEKPQRKKTRIPRRAKEARLKAKKKRSMVKAGRSGKAWEK